MSRSYVSLLLILIFPALSYAGDSDTFRNPCAGISITKPADWLYMGIDQNYQNLKNSKMKDEELKKLSLRMADVPMIVIMKYPEPYKDLNPTFKIDAKPAGQYKGTNPKKILSAMTASMGDFFDGFKIIKGPVDAKIDGMSGAYIRFNTIMKTENGQSYPSCSEIWVIPRGDHVFMFSANTRQDEKNCKRDEIRKIIDSIKIDR
jgi:hypothetical protein